MNSLPKTVTRNPGPSAPGSSTLTTRLPSRPRHVKYNYLSRQTTKPAKSGQMRYECAPAGRTEQWTDRQTDRLASRRRLDLLLTSKSTSCCCCCCCCCSVFVRRARTNWIATRPTRPHQQHAVAPRFRRDAPACRLNPPPRSEPHSSSSSSSS